MPSQLDRVPNDDYSQQIAEIEEMSEEVGIMRPGERLSEAFPGQFDLYCEHFVDFFPKANYHVKTTYSDSGLYTGWYRKLRKKPNANGERTPHRLVDSPKWLNRTSNVERHLDHEQWRLHQDHNGIGYRPTEFFWLGQQMPKKTCFHAIDADNKTRIGWYGEGTTDRPMMPVMEIPFDHFVKLKKLYDAFPDRIWCVTSETLGLDIIEKHRLQSTDVVHERTKRRLSRIGLGDTEVHPMSGRCKRRPFGEHYRTITADGVLTTWQHQLDYYLNPGQTPSFRQIAVTLLDALEDQWSSWLSDQHQKRNRGIDVLATVELKREVARKVLHWLDDGCPPVERTKIAVIEDVPRKLATARRERSKATHLTEARPFDLSSLRGGNWAKALEEIARNGLPADDSVGQVVFEMAKWLWWVELFEVPEEDRDDRVLGLLTKFVTEKHNGFVSRWNQGQEEPVLLQVSRCLKSAIALEVRDRTSCLNTFESLRNKRANGTYNRVILLGPILLGQQEHSSKTSSSSLLSTLFSVCGFEERLNDSLPDNLKAIIAEKRGRNRIEEYATRFVNLLYQAGKGNEFVRMERQELCTLVLGYFDPTRFKKYNRILQAANIIDMDSYRAHTKYTGYRLTEETRRILDEDRKVQGMP